MAGVSPEVVVWIDMGSIFLRGEQALGGVVVADREVGGYSLTEGGGSGVCLEAVESLGKIK